MQPFPDPVLHTQAVQVLSCCNWLEHLTTKQTKLQQGCPVCMGVGMRICKAAADLVMHIW